MAVEAPVSVKQYEPPAAVPRHHRQTLFFCNTSWHVGALDFQILRMVQHAFEVLQGEEYIAPLLWAWTVCEHSWTGL